MCGIGGFRRYGPEPINDDSIMQMFGGLMTRGTHAAGIALQHPDGSIYTLKDGVSAMKLMSKPEWGEFLNQYLEDAIICLLHTRLATQGSPSDNDNNHPLSVGLTSVVHNGMISNDDDLFKELRLERKAEVDSDVIRAILDEKGLNKDGIEMLKGLQGSAAIAAISRAEPGKLLLARSGNPIVMAYSGDTLMFASEKRFLHSAARPTVKKWNLWWQRNIPDCAFSTMGDETAEILGAEGLEWQEEFKMRRWGQVVNYGYSADNSWRRGRARWGHDRLPEYATCLNPECRRVSKIAEYQKDRPLHKLLCGKCNQPLGAEKKVEVIEA